MDMIRYADGMSNVVLADLELRHLAALQAVAEEGSFGRAATKLGYTQSAVSQQIGALERIIGDPVFDRPGGPRAVTLTPTGTLLLNHANSILDRVKVAEADLNSLRCAESGHLAVGTFQSVSVHVLPQVLAELHQSHPDVEIELFESDELNDLLNALRTGKLDISFTASVFESDEFALRPLHTDPFVVMCPLDSAILPEVGPVPVASLQDVPMVAEHPTACQFMIEEQLARLGVSMNVVFRTSDNSAIQAMVRAGVGHAVAPQLAVDLSDDRIAIRSLDPPMEPRLIALASVCGRSLPPIAEVFMEAAARRCAQLI